MTDELSPRIRRMLDAERAELTPDPASRAAIRAATRAALGLPTGGSSGSGNEGTPDGAPPDASSAGLEASSATAGLRAMLATKTGTTLLGAVFLAGASVGAGTHALLAPRAPIEAREETPRDRDPIAIASPEPEETPPDTPTTLVPAPIAEAPIAEADHDGDTARDSPRMRSSRPAEPPVATAEAPPTASDLVAERVLLERAEAALRRGRPDDAREALDEHTRRFSSGLLAAERDGLRALTAIAANEPDARTHAERYLERHPQGVLSARVRRALETSP